MNSSRINRGWVEVPKKDMTYSVSRYTWVTEDIAGVSTTHEVFEDCGSFYRLPWIHLRTMDYTPDGASTPKMRSKGLQPISLRDYQVEPVEECVEGLQEHLGGILRAQGGRGKTVMAIEIARRLGVRTCIFVHQEFLKSQWLNEISEKLPGASVGVIQGSTAEYGAKYDFSVAMVNTVCGKEYPEEFYSQFGLLIFDEAHRYGSREWGKVLTQFSAKYRLGVTATPDRKDGRFDYVEFHIGPTLVNLEAESLKCRVFMVDTGLQLDRKKYYRVRYKMVYGEKTKSWEPNYAIMTNLISADKGRNDLIATAIRRLSKKRAKIIVLCERLSQVDYLMESLSDLDVVKYVGGSSKKSKELRQAVPVNKIMIATYHLAKEGLNIPEMDTLVLPAVRSDVRQACWRIARDFPGKQEPVIIDFYDNVEASKKLAAKRRAVYEDLEYKVSSLAKDKITE